MIIFDLDGTLALIDKRRAISAKPNGKINWKTFFDPENIKLDEPNHSVIEMARILSQTHFIQIFSGRSDGTLDKTIDWLLEHNVPYDSLVMRDSSTPETLHMPDDILKKGWLEDLIKEGVIKSVDDITCVFDDRDKVVKMWRDMGISTFQVNYGNF